MSSIEKFNEQVIRIDALIAAIKALGFGGITDVEFEGETKASLEKRFQEILESTEFDFDAAETLLADMTVLRGQTETVRDQAESARDAALLSRGVFETTAKGLSKGVASLASLVAGSGGTNGTFPLAFTGGGGSGAAGVFTVAGGAVVSTTLTYSGTDYTSAPTVSFAASAGLTGASATAVIANNTDVGEFFAVPQSGATAMQFYQNIAGVAIPVGPAISARLSEPASNVGNTIITVNMQTQLITTNAIADIWASKTGFGYIAANQSVAFVNSGSSLMYLYVNSDGSLSIVTAPTLPPSTSALLGYVYRQIFYSFSSSGKIKYVDQVGGGFIVGPSGGVAAFSQLLKGTIAIDMQTGVATTSGVSSLAVSADSYVVVPNSQSISFSTVSPTAIRWVSVNRETGVLSVSGIGISPPSNHLVLAALYDDKCSHISPSGAITYKTSNGIVAASGLPSKIASLTSEATVTVNMQAGTFSVASFQGLAVWDSSYIALPNSQSGTFVTTSPAFIRWVFVDKVTGLVGITAGGVKPADGGITLAVLYNNKCVSFSDAGRIVFINSSGVSDIPALSDGFSELITRSILADDMYLPSSGSLPLYRDSCFSNSNVALTNNTKFWLNGGQTVPNAKTFRDIQEVIELNPTDLASVFEVSYRHETNQDVRYIKQINKRAAVAGSLTGRSFNMMTIGDSLTEGGMAFAFKTKLTALGATINTVGTYASAATLGQTSEGRGFWAWRAFVGKSNRMGGQALSLPSPGTTTTKYQNPFLRLATGTDTTNHPTWCFRNTGSSVEHSYATDPSPGAGNFYIFDFANYLSSRSVAAPDFITIGLSTNDIQLDNGDYNRAERLANMRLALDIMVSQIRAALPTVKIGIIPAPAWSSTTYADGFEAEVCEWIEACMTDVRAKSDANLYVIPVWQHMARDWIYPGTSVDLSATSKVKKLTINDRIHFNAVGVDQYAQVVAAWAESTL